jgi:hypothetical protein
MTRTTQTLPAETAGTDITRFNALRHGVLSRFTVLPWEDADEYQAIVSALVDEHVPQGPTEEHLVRDRDRTRAPSDRGRAQCHHCPGLRRGGWYSLKNLSADPY